MKAIILTGATGGLGRSLVEILRVDDDKKLICIYRNQQKYEKLFGEKESIHGYLIRDNDDFTALLENDVITKCDSVILILNAFSISPIKRIGDYSSNEVAEFIYGNITRNVLLLNTVIKHCKETDKALRIINLDSGAADFPLTGWGNYCSAKAYLNSFISVIALENPKFQIVSFDPGVMDTSMQTEIRLTDKSIFDQVHSFQKYKEEGRLNNPLEVARQIKERYVSDWKAESYREKI